MVDQHRNGEKVDSSGDGRLGRNHSSSTLPQELIDLIIDTISDDGEQSLIHARTLSVATIRACALVSHGWTGRAQRRIFESAEICSTASLYSFVEVLRAAPKLAAVVQRLTFIRGTLDPFNSLFRYLPDCSEGLFPTVLTGLLPNLRSLAFSDLRSLSRAPLASTSAGYVPRLLQSCVPIHHRFPLLLSSSGFADLRELHLASVIFPTFNDFARTLHVLARLRVLHCGDVDWITLGVLLPPFMTPAGATRKNGKFLPALEQLTAVTVGRHGVQRLLTGLALSASLRSLTVFLSTIGNIPHMHPSVDPATGMSDGLDLSLFPRLSDLSVFGIFPQSFRSAQRALLCALHDLLASWSDESPSRSLTLGIKPAPSPYSGNGSRFYTKQNYMSFLDAVGRTVEGACTLRGRDSSTVPALRALLEIPQDATSSLEELEREADAQFPISLKAGKLTVQAHTSEYSHFSWKTSAVDEGRTP